MSDAHERPPEPEAEHRLTRRTWLALALSIFVFANAMLFSAAFGQDLHTVVLANFDSESAGQLEETRWETLGRTDLRFGAWLIARNAEALTHAPHRFFDAGICYPSEKALAYGEPGGAQGFVAIPFWLVSGDPIFTFNAVLLSLGLIAALGMFFLVRELTASWPAAIASGVFFAFHYVKAGDVIHPFVWDNAWTAFALYFALRLVRGSGRGWPAAFGLAACACLQISGSIYPALAAVMIGLPFLGWALSTFGVRKLPVAPSIVCVAVVLVFGIAFMRPYLALDTSGDLEAVPFQVFRPLGWILPGGRGFAGWIAAALIVLALASRFMAGGAGLRGSSEPVPGLASLAWVMAATALSIIGFSVLPGAEPGAETIPAIGGVPPEGSLPNLYLWIAVWLPGLDAVRGPGSLYVGAHLCLAIAVGLGAAALLARWPSRRGDVLGLALVALVFVETLSPAWLGLDRGFEYRPIALRPDARALALYAELEAMGNAGPLLEYPMNRVDVERASAGQLLAAYHGRATSHCYNSVMPAVTTRVIALLDRLPGAEAVAEARRLGFTTLVVRHHEDEAIAWQMKAALDRAAASPARRDLRPLASNAGYSAWALEAP